MEHYYYRDRQNLEPLFPRETLLRKAEDYLKTEREYRQVFTDYRTATGETRTSLAYRMQALHARMQMLRNTYVLTIGGLHGQEMIGTETLYDPVVHTCTTVHGNTEPGDPIRFLNTAICASDDSVLIPSQGLRVY